MILVAANDKKTAAESPSSPSTLSKIPVPLLPSSSSSPYQLKSSVVKATPTLSLCDVTSLHSFSYLPTSFFILYLSEHLLSSCLQMSPECFTMATVALVSTSAL